MSRRIRNKTQKIKKRNNSPFGELFWIHFTQPSCTHPGQIKYSQPFEKGQLQVTGTTQEKLYTHIGQYFTIHPKYVNENLE